MFQACCFRQRTCVAQGLFNWVLVSSINDPWLVKLVYIGVVVPLSWSVFTLVCFYIYIYIYIRAVKMSLHEFVFAYVYTYASEYIYKVLHNKLFIYKQNLTWKPTAHTSIFYLALSVVLLFSIWSSYICKYLIHLYVFSIHFIKSQTKITHEYSVVHFCRQYNNYWHQQRIFMSVFLKTFKYAKLFISVLENMQSSYSLLIFYTNIKSVEKFEDLRQNNLHTY